MTVLILSVLNAQNTAVLYAVILSVFIFVIFKELGRRGIQPLPIIIINYFVCFVLGNFWISAGIGSDSNGILIPRILQLSSISKVEFFALSAGALFLITFLFMAQATQKAGAAASSVASKMSMVIPILSAIVIWKESINLYNYLGIFFALIAVYLMVKPNKLEGLKWDIVLIWVFIGSGLVDLSINFLNKINHGQLSNMQLTTHTFTGAFFTGLVYVFIKKDFIKFGVKANWFWGIILGTVNLFSIVALYNALDTFPNQASSFFTINNILVVAGASIVGIFYREKWSLTKAVGLILALFSIYLVR